MSKKKNKLKARFKKMGKEYKKAQKKGGKSFAKKYKANDVKSIKNTVDKKDIKRLQKYLEEMSESPLITTVRKQCNHLHKDGVLLVRLADFDKSKLYLMRNLELMKTAYGEDKLNICSRCYTVVPDMNATIKANAVLSDLEKAECIMYTSVEHSAMYMKSSKKVEKLHDNLFDIIQDTSHIKKAYEKHLENSSNISPVVTNAVTAGANNKKVNYANLGQ